MDWLSLYPLDPRCTLLTNLVWSPDDHGVPCLHRQKLWVRFPEPLATEGLRAAFSRPVGRVLVETAEDEAGARWRTLAEADLAVSPHAFAWPETTVSNLRVQVSEPTAPLFPLGYYFSELALCVAAGQSTTLPVSQPVVPDIPLDDISQAVVEPFAGHAGVPANEQLGLCHDRPRTDRLSVSGTDEEVVFSSPVWRMAFDRRHARVTHLSWDSYGQGRQADNLLSTEHTHGAFPVVLHEGRRVASESCGGALELSGRRLRYLAISPLPALTWDYAFSLRENGFLLDVSWDCTETLVISELAALRIPLDLYRTVTSVLAMPDTTGPSGLVDLPLVINAPNHGVVRVTVRDNPSSAPTHARILPFRARAELWLDLIPGAEPLPSGLLRMPVGKGTVTLDFELTQVFPLANQDQSSLYGWWELPPFYSFAEREAVLGALPNAWLTGLSFRPDLGRFANNAVADSAAGCAPYYADIAAYSPMLADGLDPRQFIRVAAEQLLRDTSSAADYSNWAHYPSVPAAIIDCAWLYVASSGDWAWAERWHDAIRYYASALQQREYLDTGLVVSDYSGIPEEEGGYMAACWCDSIRSGHLESYVNAHVYRGLGRAAELLERLHEEPVAAAARAQAERLKSSFLPTFYDTQARRIMQWVARDGRRFGFDSHMHLGAAVALGLAPDDLGRQLLGEYLARLTASGFTHYEWGLPIFLDPVPAVCHNDWKGRGVEPDGSDQVGIYQNGAIQAHQTYYILQALYKTGLRREANGLFGKMTPLVRRGGLCGGLHSGVDWRHPVDGRPTGYEGLLAEQFHFLLAAITGYLGCELTIDGLIIHGPDTARIRALRPNFARMAEG
jgi:hypothetical protein